MSHILVNDRYRRARGGYARLLNIFCASCGAMLFAYQKDGPGPLKRVYLDRIYAEKAAPLTRALRCKKCESMIGTYYIYKKEKRPAFRLYRDVVTKKLKGIKK